MKNCLKMRLLFLSRHRSNRMMPMPEATAIGDSVEVERVTVHSYIRHCCADAWQRIKCSRRHSRLHGMPGTVSALEGTGFCTHIGTLGPYAVPRDVSAEGAGPGGGVELRRHKRASARP